LPWSIPKFQAKGPGMKVEGSILMGFRVCEVRDGDQIELRVWFER